MNREILPSLITISTVVALVSGATFAFFQDTETSSGNTFTAGSLDLKIDLQCDPPGPSCDFSLRDLGNDGRAFFEECDIKPGDWNEVTISWHVDNNAWARIRLADIKDYEEGCTEPEEETGDTDCGDPGEGEGELDDNLIFTLWMDEGSVTGWQCPNNEPCLEDPEEGDNILNGIETILAKKTARELVDGVKLHYELVPSTTYYLGMKWEVPIDTGNIIQTDSLVGKIVMEVEQSRNNPDPWP
jgi:predicted ribosomally synthesized peptide with SipW-like signal peptide